jgi:hypothetical protein
MPVYAKGKKALAICDRSGFRIPYKNLRTEWTGFRVAPDEYEPKNPQLTPPKNIIDATALFKPRPDNDPENISIFINYNWFNFNVPNADSDGFTQPSLDSTTYKKPNQTVAKGSIGFVTLGISKDVNATGVSGSGVVGAEILEASITESGVAGSGAVGTETFESTITETGVAGTGALGAFGESGAGNLTVSITESGLAGTGAVGSETVDVDNPTWGSGTWGNGAWGQ